MSEEKRMYDNHKEHGEDLSYENEQSMVTIPLKEYDKIADISSLLIANKVSYKFNRLKIDKLFSRIINYGK